jgi:hypothetical protein
MSSAREAAAAESWQRTLSNISTLFGRVAYLASLRDANTGIYQHHGLAQRIGEEAADAIIRRSHMAVFQEWLCFGLQLQKEEVEAYFAELEGNRRDIIASWLTLEPWGNWVPAESRDVERKLFCTDLAAVLELLRAEYGVASPDPES